MMKQFDTKTGTLRAVGFAALLALNPWLISPPIAEAQEDYMGAGEIRGTLANTRVLLDSPLGQMPLNYRSDGTVTGDGSGIGLGRFFAPKETGRWWVNGDRLCQRWPTWYDGATNCFRLQKLNENSFRWQRQDGKTGTAKIASPAG